MIDWNWVESGYLYFQTTIKTYITHIDPSNCCFLRVTKTHFWCILTMHVLARPTGMKPPTSLTWSPLNVQCFYPNYLSKPPLIHWRLVPLKRSKVSRWFSFMVKNRCINRQPMWLKLPRVYGPLVVWWKHYPVVNLAESSRSDLVLRSLWFYRYFMDIIYDAQPKTWSHGTNHEPLTHKQQMSLTNPGAVICDSRSAYMRVVSADASETSDIFKKTQH